MDQNCICSALWTFEWKWMCLVHSIWNITQIVSFLPSEFSRQKSPILFGTFSGKILPILFGSKEIWRTIFGHYFAILDALFASDVINESHFSWHTNFGNVRVGVQWSRKIHFPRFNRLIVTHTRLQSQLTKNQLWRLKRIKHSKATFEMSERWFVHFRSPSNGRSCQKMSQANLRRTEVDIDRKMSHKKVEESVGVNGQKIENTMEHVWCI